MSEQETQVTETTEESVDTEARLEELKKVADSLKISYHPKIGYDKLLERVEEVLGTNQGTQDSEESSEEPKSTKPKTVDKSSTAYKLERRREALKLVRVRITCMNPAKKSHQGEIFTVGNSNIPTQKRMVPFNVPWHVPNIMLKFIQSKEFRVTRSTKINGHDVQTNSMVKEYAVEILPSLTAKELRQLGLQQKARKGQSE